MVPALLIMVREGFEAALVVSIVFAYLRRIDRLDLGRSAWLGVAGAAALSVLIGVVVHLTIGSLEGDARLRSFAVVSILAAAVLTWMVFWMRRQSRAIKGDIEQHIDQALEQGEGGNVRRAVTLVAFLAVLREGVEAALFLIAAATSADGGQVALGAVIGLAIASVLGLGVYHGGRRLPMKTFFTISGLVIIVFAAGLIARSVGLLQATGDLGSVAGLDSRVYDLRAHEWLTTKTETGKFLSAMFGWSSAPTFERVALWLAYLVPVTYFFLRRSSGPKPETTPVAPAPAAASSSSERVSA